MAVEDYSTSAASNTSIGGISIAEGWSPASVNNALRQLMADIANWRDGAIADLGGAGDYQPLDATLTALAGLATGANKIPYSTGTNTFAQTDITSYGRTLLGLSNAAALRSNIGAVTVSGAFLGSPGYVKLNISGTDFIIQWGTGTAAPNTTTSRSYATSFSTFSIPVVSGGTSDSNAQDNAPAVVSAGASSFSVFNARDESTPFWFIAVGV